MHWQYPYCSTETIYSAAVRLFPLFSQGFVLLIKMPIVLKYRLWRHTLCAERWLAPGYINIRPSQKLCGNNNNSSCWSYTHTFAFVLRVDEDPGWNDSENLTQACNPKTRNFWERNLRSSPPLGINPTSRNHVIHASLWLGKHKHGYGFGDERFEFEREIAGTKW